MSHSKQSVVSAIDFAAALAAYDKAHGTSEQGRGSPSPGSRGNRTQGSPQRDQLIVTAESPSLLAIAADTSFQCVMC